MLVEVSETKAIILTEENGIVGSALQLKKT